MEIIEVTKIHKQENNESMLRNKKLFNPEGSFIIMDPIGDIYELCRKASNNWRRMHGLPMRRGSINKKRIKYKIVAIGQTGSGMSFTQKLHSVRNHEQKRH